MVKNGYFSFVLIFLTAQLIVVGLYIFNLIHNEKKKIFLAILAAGGVLVVLNPMLCIYGKNQ